LRSRFVLSFAPAVAVHSVMLLGLSTLARPAVSVHSGDVLYVTVVPAKVEARPDLVREAAPPPAPPGPKPKPLAPAARPRPKQRRADEPTATEPAIDPETAAVPAADPGPPTPIPPEPSPLGPATVAPELPLLPGSGESVKARPRYRSNPRPNYPVSALRHREEGVALLDVDVTAEGRAAAVALKHGSGFDDLDKAALETVKGWTFEPARVDGKPVAGHVEVPVRFSLDGR